MTLTHLVFNPLLPWPWLFLATAAIVICALARPARWRWVVAAALLVVLAGPQQQKTMYTPKKDQVVVVVDQSRSNQVPGRKEATNRTAKDLKTALANLPDVATITLTTTDSTSRGSDMFSQIKSRLDSLAPERLSAILLVTDGDISHLPDAKTLPAPVHILRTAPENSYDRRLVVTQAPAFALLNQPQQMTLEVQDDRVDTVPVTLHLSGQKPLVFDAPTNKPFHLTFTLAHAGSTALTLDVPVEKDELTASNNRAVTLVTGVREHVNILLISGFPNNSTMVIRNLLKSDPAVNLVHFAILRTLTQIDPTPDGDLSLIPFPARQLFEDRLNSFDLVIFDNYTHRNLVDSLYFKNISRYVKKGGALMVLAEPQFGDDLGLAATPLREVLPITPTGQSRRDIFRPRLTDVGKRHPITAPLVPQAKTWGRMGQIVPVQVNSGYTLLTGPQNLPLLSVAKVGEGRVGLWLSEHWWFWNRGIDGGGPQVELLRRMAHWLLGEAELEEERLTGHMANNSLAVAYSSVDQPKSVPVTVTTPRGETQTLALTADNHYQQDMPASEEGLYTLEGAGHVAYAVKGAVRDEEWLPVAPDDLRNLAKATGGSVTDTTKTTPTLRRVSAASRLYGPGWIGLPQKGSADLTGTTTTPLIPAWLGALLLVAALAWAWWRESV